MKAISRSACGNIARKLIATNAATLCAAFCFLAANLAGNLQAQTPSLAPGSAPVAKPPAGAALASPPIATPAFAPIFTSIGDKPAIVYDAPSGKAQKTFILSRLHPVEVLVKLDKWVKIRDAENTVGWVESSALGATRTVQISVNSAEIRAMPNANAVIVFDALRLVVLEATGPAVNGWLPVRHRDGQTGFVSKSQVWGD